MFSASSSPAAVAVSEPTEQFGPRRVLAEITAHDTYMSDEREQMALHKAMYGTRFWTHGQVGKSPRSARSSDVDIEVNRLFTTVNTYLAALYRVASRVACSPDPQGRGDAEIATLVLNAWLAQSIQEPTVLSALRQALLYPGCGLKVTVNAGRGSALGRVWMSVVPWNELVLDRSVSDVRYERYRGHVYMVPRKEILEKYPKQLAGVELKGTRKADFLGANESNQASNDQAKDAQAAQIAAKNAKLNAANAA